MNILFELLASLFFGAAVVAVTLADGFSQPETPPKPPAIVQQRTEPPPVLDIWEIVRNDNQTAADICAARGRP